MTAKGSVCATARPHPTALPRLPGRAPRLPRRTTGRAPRFQRDGVGRPWAAHYATRTPLPVTSDAARCASRAATRGARTGSSEESGGAAPDARASMARARPHEPERRRRPRGRPSPPRRYHDGVTGGERLAQLGQDERAEDDIRVTVTPTVPDSTGHARGKRDAWQEDVHLQHRADVGHVVAPSLTRGTPPSRGWTRRPATPSRPAATPQAREDRRRPRRHRLCCPRRGRRRGPPPRRRRP
jgi:hypothetical protein